MARVAKPTWRVGELARRSGVGAKTLRYYDEVGLLPPAGRSDGGYRLYDHSSVARLDFIRKAQQLGLSLAEIGGILRLRDGGLEPCAHVAALLDEQIARADRAQSQLEEFTRELRRLRGAARRTGKGGAAVCQIIEHKAASIDVRALLPLLGTTKKIR